MNLPIPLYGFVTEQEKRKTKKGDKFFWQVNIKTTAGNIKCFMWNAGADAEISSMFPHVGDIIEIKDYEDQLAERGTIVINKFRRLVKEQLPDDVKVILEFDKASDEEIDWAVNLIFDSSYWDNPDHHHFVISCLKKLDKEKLRACPAATRVHHQYHGGLLVHTAEVLELCRSVAETCSKRYSFVNRDVLYASAILHDIGKVETYSISEIGVAQSLVTEKTIGHIFYGMHIAQAVGTETQVDLDFLNEVLHCIASHHGLIEWGSVKIVQSIEAGILSRVDYISSRNGMVESLLKETVKSGQPLQDEFRIYNDPYFASIGMKKYVRNGCE